MITRRLTASHPLLLVALLTLAACDDLSGPGSGAQEDYLAGGGRALSEDAFVGGREASGPVAADRAAKKPDVAPGFPAVFYSELNCFGTPFERVIASQADWDAWRKTAVSCQPAPKPYDGGDPTVPPKRPEVSEPDPKPDPRTDPAGPAALDFVRSAVIAIGLESAKGWGRRLQVVDVATSGETTTVRYEVLTPGEDCTKMLMGPFDPNSVVSAPVTAVLVRRPLGGKVVFQRKDAVWHCVVQPDPKEPLNLYYTDASCDLGEGEVVFREAARWNAWLARAVDCERARWGSKTDPGLPRDLPATITVDASRPPEPPSGWLSPTVDFSTHAVLILRAPAQTRWGGGVWLTGLDVRGGATAVRYMVKSPGRDCPAVEGGLTVRPTVAIRVPLPLPAPVAFRSAVETIDCRWKREPATGGVAAGSGGTPTTASR